MKRFSYYLVTILLLLIINSNFPNLIFAETIILKSGHTIEGKVIEKTDKYIKIDFEGIPLTYFFEDIESIDGVKIILPTMPLPLPKVASEQKDNRQDVLDFLMRERALVQDLGRKLEETKKLVSESKSDSDKAKIVLNEISIIRQTTEQLEKLPVPKSCEKLKELSIKSNEALIAAKDAVAKTFTGEIKDFKEQWVVIQQQLDADNQYVFERQRLLKEYNIQD